MSTLPVSPPSGRPSLLRSSVGRKILTGLTGLLLFAYLVQHLYANLHVFSADPEAFNRYAASFQRFGVLLRVAEALLALVFITHIGVGVRIALGRRRARGEGYVYRNGQGRRAYGSRSMVWSGLFVLVFLVLHVKAFTFGPGLAEGYVAVVDGATVRDFRRLVIASFRDPWQVGFYVAALAAVGLHLSHGFRSAFQSLGAPVGQRSGVYWVGVVLSAAVAGAFIAIPLWVYFGTAG